MTEGERHRDVEFPHQSIPDMIQRWNIKRDIVVGESREYSTVKNVVTTQDPGVPVSQGDVAVPGNRCKKNGGN